MATEFVKVTTRDFVKVFSIHDVKANGIEYAPSVWTVCRTRKAFREMIETYAESDSTYSLKKHTFIHHNRRLTDDCMLWIGEDGNNGECFEAGDALPKAKTNDAFRYGHLSTAYDLATYGDAFHLSYTSDDPEITYVRDNDEFYDDETALTLDEIPEYTESTIKEENESMTIYERMTANLEARTDKSAWNRGVTAYALELVESLQGSAEYHGRDPESGKECREWMLNGARDWEAFSYGGSALIYDGDIAARLCTPSELRRTRDGEREPNRRETWLDVQARALHQASGRIAFLYTRFTKEVK